MMNKNDQNNSIRIAAPYYGSMSHPSRGLNNLYFLIDIDRKSRQVERMHVSVWNPSENSRLGSWFSKNGIRTLICNTIENCLAKELNESGVRIDTLENVSTDADIIKKIRTWLRGNEPIPA